MPIGRRLKIAGRKLGLRFELKKNRQYRAWRKGIYSKYTTEELERIGINAAGLNSAPKSQDGTPRPLFGFKSFAEYGAHIIALKIAMARKKEQYEKNKKRGKGKSSPYKLTGIRK